MKSNRIMVKKIYVFVLILIFYIFSFNIFAKASVINRYVCNDIYSLDLSKVNNLMIVAHPDDDIIWGGSHLIEDDYLVVCITAGTKEKRCKEFISAMNETGDIPFMLGYPDKTFFMRNDWDGCRVDIYDDIKNIIELKDWDMIVTHNPDGEYGHIHHKMTSQIVSDVYKELFSDGHDLWYFGIYHTKDEMNNIDKNTEKISDDNLNKKIDIIENVYKSQYFVMDKFGHMLPYENFYQAF